MINVAVVAEYNPFHNGHLFQIDSIRRHFYPEPVRIIALMSGNYVQRGALAVAHKYTRAAHAVMSGIDLVLELPFPFSMSGAESFAGAACDIIDRLCDIDFLCFGSECGESDYIRECAENLLSEGFQSALALAVSSEFTLSYASVRERLYEEMFGKKLPKTPNDILALEYVKALIETGSSVRVLAFKRMHGFSASASRAAILSGSELSELVPGVTESYFESSAPLELSLLDTYIVERCALADSEDFENISEYNYDLAQKTLRCARKAENTDMLVDLISDKRYTRARVRRALLNFILSVKSTDLHEKITYVFALGMSESGREYLSEKQCSLKIVTRISELCKEERNSRLFALSSKADALYERKAEQIGVEFPKKPYIGCEN